MTTTHDAHEPCLCGEPTIDGLCPIPECVASSHDDLRRDPIYCIFCGEIILPEARS